MNRAPTPPEDAPFQVVPSAPVVPLAPSVARPELDAGSVERPKSSLVPWLLVGAALTLVLSGVVAWLWHRVSPAPSPVVPVVKSEPAPAAPAVVTPQPAPEAVAPAVPVPAPRLRSKVPSTPDEKPRPQTPRRAAPAEPIPSDTRVHGAVLLGDGSDPTAAVLTLYPQGRDGGQSVVTHPLEHGRVELELEPGGWYLVATAPHHALKTLSFTVAKGEAAHWGPLVLEREKTFIVGTPGQSHRVRSGDRLPEVQFLQQNGALIMLGNTCVCVMRNADDSELDTRRCWVAMVVGEQYLVQPTPDAPWLPITLVKESDEPFEALRKPAQPRLIQAASP